MTNRRMQVVVIREHKRAVSCMTPRRLEIEHAISKIFSSFLIPW